MRDALGDGYTDTVRKVHSVVGESSDFVMYWWNHAAELLRTGTLNRFGFVTTNSISQKFNRRVIERHLAAKNPVSLIYAIPDHPWVDAADGAAVRIAMTAAQAGEAEGLLQTVVEEKVGDSEGYDVQLVPKSGIIHPDLSIGVDLGSTVALMANSQISNRGFELGSDGFIVTREEAISLGLDRLEGIGRYIREYRNGKDLTNKPRGVLCIDPWDLDEADLINLFPEIHQWLSIHVKPKRLTNRDERLRRFWWKHRRSREDLRNSIKGIPRYIATVETSKHRFFQFLDQSILPDNKLINIALDDACFLGLLSSRIHLVWVSACGALLEDRPVYVKTTCFETFPFPDATEEQKAKIRSLGEQLDAHRKRQQQQHPGLTMTGMYNVLEKLRAGEALTAKEKTIHEQGLVSVVKQLHDELDAAVAEAYGWPADGADDEILERVVALNAERAAEEAQGKVRWLRPGFQCPEAVQGELNVDGASSSVADAKPATATKQDASSTKKQPWPKTLPEQVQTLRAALAAAPSPATAEQLARSFSRARTDRVADLLETLATLGQAQKMADGRYAVG